MRIIKKCFKDVFWGLSFKLALFFILTFTSHNMMKEKKKNSGGIFNTLTSSDDYKGMIYKIIDAVDPKDSTFTFSFSGEQEGILFENIELDDPSFDAVDDFTIYEIRDVNDKSDSNKDKAKDKK